MSNKGSSGRHTLTTNRTGLKTSSKPAQIATIQTVFAPINESVIIGFTVSSL